MIAWFRRVLASFLGWFDLVARVEELERRFRDIELDWIDQVDKLTKLQKRANKRAQDAATSMEEQYPTAAEVRLTRRERIRRIQQGGTG